MLNNHKSKILLFTGLSGSGKSTIKNMLDKRLYDSSIRTYILDGDNLRLGINKDLGFNEKDRIENIRRASGSFSYAGFRICFVLFYITLPARKLKSKFSSKIL